MLLVDDGSVGRVAGDGAVVSSLGLAAGVSSCSKLRTSDSVCTCVVSWQLRIGKLLLGKLTSDVDSAADGLEAFQAPAQPIRRARCQHAQMFKKNSFSIVFMDCHMPVCDGAASCLQAGSQGMSAGIDLECSVCWWRWRWWWQGSRARG